MSKSERAMQLVQGAAGVRAHATRVGFAADASAAIPGQPTFRWVELAGRFVEISGHGASSVLTLAMGVVLDAQRQNEPVAWVTSSSSSFYPPDVADTGIDLEALVIVRIAQAQATPAKLAVAAERLLRSGAFGLLVLDLGRAAELTQPLQTRLLGLAQKHHAALLCLTEKRAEDPSLGSLVSLRAQANRSWLTGDRFMCEARVLKDKRRGPVWSEREVCRGPMGLR